jgi:hypothetical protein
VRRVVAFGFADNNFLNKFLLPKYSASIVGNHFFAVHQKREVCCDRFNLAWLKLFLVYPSFTFL